MDFWSINFESKTGKLTVYTPLILKEFGSVFFENNNCYIDTY